MFWVLCWKIQTPTPGTQISSCSPTQKKLQTNQPKIQIFISSKICDWAVTLGQNSFYISQGAQLQNCALNYNGIKWFPVWHVQKKKEVAARCKYCFETLIPPDKSCVEELSYTEFWYIFFWWLCEVSPCRRVWKLCTYFSWRMYCFLPAWTLTLLNWVEIAVHSLG